MKPPPAFARSNRTTPGTVRPLAGPRRNTSTHARFFRSCLKPSISPRLRQPSRNVLSSQPRSSTENLFQHIKAALIFLRCSDGNANPLGQRVSAHRAHDHAKLLYFVKDQRTI